MSGVLVLRAGSFSRRTTTRALVAGLLLTLTLAACLLAALMLGTRTLAPGDVFAALGPAANPADRLVVLEWRAPRAVAAALFGACLGLSGAIFQSLTRNPLGSPDVIGLNTGAYTGVVCALTVGATGFAAQAAGAIFGGLGAVVIVYLFSFRQGVLGIRLIIVGIAVSAMLSSVNTWFGVKADLDVALQLAVWGAGTCPVWDGRRYCSRAQPLSCSCSWDRPPAAACGNSSSVTRPRQCWGSRSNAARWGYSSSAACSPPSLPQ